MTAEKSHEGAFKLKFWLNCRYNFDREMSREMSEAASEGKGETAGPTGSTAEEAMTSPTITNLTSQMTRYKRDVTVSLKNAEKQIQQIKAAMEKGQRAESNMLLEGMIKTALGNLDNAKLAKSNLADAISQFIGEIESIRIRFPDAKEL